MNRWLISPTRTELFQLSVSHLAKLPSLPRAALSERLYCDALHPLLSAYLLIENGPADSQVEKSLTETAVNKFLSMITDSKLIVDFIRSCLDLLDFAEVAVSYV